MRETITIAEALQIVRQERERWDDFPGDTHQRQVASAAGATACINIMSILKGLRDAPDTENGKAVSP